MFARSGLNRALCLVLAVGLGVIACGGGETTAPAASVTSTSAAGQTTSSTSAATSSTTIPATSTSTTTTAPESPAMAFPVWGVTEDGFLLGVDAETGLAHYGIEVGVSGPLDASMDAFWVGSCVEGLVVRLDFLTGETTSTDLGSCVADVLAGEDGVLVALPDAGAVVRLDPTSGVELDRFSAQEPVGLAEGSIAVLAANGIVASYGTGSDWGNVHWTNPDFPSRGVGITSTMYGDRQVILVLAQPRFAPFVVAFDADTGEYLGSWDPPIQEAGGLVVVSGVLVVWSGQDEGMTVFAPIGGSRTSTLETPGVTSVGSTTGANGEPLAAIATSVAETPQVGLIDVSQLLQDDVPDWDELFPDPGPLLTLDDALFVELAPGTSQPTFMLQPSHVGVKGDLLWRLRNPPGSEPSR